MLEPVVERMFNPIIRLTSLSLSRVIKCTIRHEPFSFSNGLRRYATTAATEEYDYIVVGAGSAGCVVAHRLVTGDNALRVLLTEAGPARDQYWKIRMPGGMITNLHNTDIDWSYQTEPQKNWYGRRTIWPRGKLLGGSSSLNAMMYIRGHAADYDRWAKKEGATGWSYAECLPYFKKAQKHELGANEYRGGSGPLYVSPCKIKTPIHEAFIAAGMQAGYQQTDDFNGKQQEGFGWYDSTICNGQRGSTAARYLHPALKQAGHRLTALPDTLVTKVVFNGRRAVGIEFQTGGKGNPVKRVRASREIILCGGAVNSPQLLLLSGVGPADHLRQHGISLVHNLPGVGKNLQDHLCVPVVFRYRTGLHNKWTDSLMMSCQRLRWRLFSTGPMTTLGIGAGTFIRSRTDVEHPDLQFAFFSASWVVQGKSQFDFDNFMPIGNILRPTSRGSITLKSSDPTQHPAIQPNYLDTQEDLENARSIVKIGREIISQPAFDPYRGEELLPGKRIQTDNEIDEFVRRNSDAYYHPTSSCSMGSPDKNKMAVVDTACRVVGVTGLRVVDASVMPSIISGNTDAPTIMIAEKVSDAILGINPLPALKS